MHMQLICLYEKGRRLSYAELEDAPRYTGNFVIEERPSGGQYSASVAGRSILQARILKVQPNVSTDLIPPLFDPICVRVDDSRMTFTGWSISTDADGQAIHYAQSWVVKPAPA